MLRLASLLLPFATRHRLRLTFTLASILIAFLLFGLLGAVDHAFSRGVEVAGQDRMMVMHRTSIIQPLPRAYLGRVRGLPEVRAAASLSWFGGWYREPRNQLAAFAVDAEYFDLYPELHIEVAALTDWRGDRAAAIVGPGLAAEFGWRVGEVVPLQSNIFRKSDGSSDWPVRIAGIYVTDVGNPRAIFIHYDYLNESRSVGKDLIGWIIVRLRSPALGPALAQEVDALFANSPTETKTSTEKAMAQSFANQIGDIGAILSYVVAAVFFTMLLVTANTMMQSVRERTPELAVLKTLGFTDLDVLLFVLSESVLIALVGGAAGLGLAYAAALALGAELKQYLPSFAMTWGTVLAGIGFMIGLGVAAGALPAISAMRLRIVEALRRG
jgi:putative ABC transport system permease protein